MSILLEVSRERSAVQLRSDSSIECAIQCLLASCHSRRHSERRREQRYPFPYPIRLTPVTADGNISPAESIVVLGKHLSEHGVDFYYNEPLPYRRVIASFERGGQEVLHLMMDLTWCRFGRHGWYENGGRFLQLLTSSPSMEA
jgi:hypothetical protein